jgi:hypothetical protein
MELRIYNYAKHIPDLYDDIHGLYPGPPNPLKAYTDGDWQSGSNKQFCQIVGGNWASKSSCDWNADGFEIIPNVNDRCIENRGDGKYNGQFPWDDGNTQNNDGCDNDGLISNG